MLARAKRDYYAVLGVARDADARAIRQAYRSLAGAFHPDVSTAPDAAERFREIAEAYETLSRPESRARYDRGRARGVTGFAAAGQGLFDDLVASAATRRRAPEPGRDATVPLVVGYLDARRGATVRAHYRAAAACEACSGPRGGVAGPCPTCGGSGRVERERVTAVRVPAGTLDGDRVVVAGAGGAGVRGGPAGDLHVVVEVAAADDAPALRLLAAVGAAVAAALLVVTLVLLL